MKRFLCLRTREGNEIRLHVEGKDAAISIAVILCDGTNIFRADYITEDNRMIFTFYGSKQ